METELTMRQEWFQHVRKTRKKLSKGKTNGKKNECTHREAMQQASKSWPQIKQKLIRKKKRLAKKQSVTRSVTNEQTTN